MIRLGLRLTLGGRESVIRLVATSLAVAVGVTLLLATLANINAAGAQNARGAWMATSSSSTRYGGPGGGPGALTPPPPGPHSIWWLVNTELYRNQLIVRIDVAAAGNDPVVPPGMSRLPGPGQFYASPALAALLRTVPIDELGDRYVGTMVGVIGSTALPSPNDLVIVIGHAASALAHVQGAGEISGFATMSGSGGPDTLGSAGLEFVLALQGLILLFPILIFIATATRLSAARREQRFAAVRLVGATMGQLTVAAAVEAAVAAFFGVVLGFAAFLPLRPLLAHLTLTGQAVAIGDLSLNLGDDLAVAVGVPFAAVIAARVALRRVHISPLGVSRRATPQPPSVLRLLPLLAGVGELAYFVAAGHPKSTGGQILAYFLGFFMVMVGVVVAGPWLTMSGARLLAKRANRPATLIAGRRISDNPRVAFRAISGLILALFITSVSFGLISTLLSDHGLSGAGSPANETVTDQYTGGPDSDMILTLPSGVLARLDSVPGVRGATVVHLAPSHLAIDGPVPDINGIGGSIQYGVVSCHQLATTPALGRCHRGSTYAAVGDDLSFMPFTKSVATAAATTWPDAHPSNGIARLPVKMVAVSTNGSATTIARVQTILDDASPFAGATSLFGEINAQKSQLLTEFQSMSEVIITVSLLIAGCSLAVAMAGGVIERKLPFSLLRLSGVPVSMLRRVVSLETALPLVVISLASSAIGLVASNLFLRSQFSITLRLPGLAYVGIVLGGLVASLLIISSTLSILEPLTRPENARWE